MLIDADAMKAGHASAQLLKVVAGRNPEILIARGIIQHLEPSEQPIFQVGRDSPGARVIYEKCPEPVIPEADNHSNPLYHPMVHPPGTVAK